MAAPAPWFAVALAATVTAAAPVRASSSQAPSWLQFHAATETERHEDGFWDDVQTPRLKPGETVIRGVHKDYGSALGPAAYDDFLRRWTCASDYVVLGTPTTSKAILTTLESNIFTDYRVNVDQWLRGGPDRGKSVVMPTTFVVSLEGGRITTGEGVIGVEDDPPLQLFAQFILFLKTIPTTSSYRLAGPALTAARTTVALRGNYFAPPGLLNGTKATSEALADIKAAASKCPGQRGGW
jgi:hypothetical protein